MGCGGTITQKSKEGCDVSVVFMTDGRNSHSKLSESTRPSPLEMKEMRKAEALNATRILGIPKQNLLFLDFEDQKLRENQDLAQEKLVSLLKELNPGEIFFPQEKEYHIDHRVTTILVRNALTILDLHPLEYKYIIAWSFPFYLFQHIMSEDMFDQVVSRFSKGKLVNLDISMSYPLKRKAIEQYKSQVALPFSGQKTPILKGSLVKRFLKCEEKFFIS